VLKENRIHGEEAPDSLNITYSSIGQRFTDGWRQRYREIR
jgi:hypothetical protein